MKIKLFPTSSVSKINAYVTTLVWWLKNIAKLGSLLTIGMSMSANAVSFGLGVDTWKEEVLLHDGSKLIVDRTVERGGRHEIGQQPPVKTESLTFTLPTTDERIIWKNEYSPDIGFADFMPMLLDVFQGTAYVVSAPVGCLSYNKWGRPNPPYVVFKFEGKAWKRTPLQELPIEMRTPNLIVSSPDNKVEQLGKRVVTAEDIRKINSSLTQPEYRTILRHASSGIAGGCSEMVHTKDGWEGMFFFKRRPSYDACLKYCDARGVSPQDCPCESIFREAK